MTVVARFESYEAWRASVQFSNEQIADALARAFADGPSNDFIEKRHRSAIAYVRTGHLTSKLLAIALPYLVTTCVVCGKKALYRWGSTGRCRAHRDIKTAIQVEYSRWRESLNSEVALAIGERESLERRVDSRRRLATTKRIRLRERHS